MAPAKSFFQSSGCVSVVVVAEALLLLRVIRVSCSQVVGRLLCVEHLDCEFRLLLQFHVALPNQNIVFLPFPLISHKGGQIRPSSLSLL